MTKIKRPRGSHCGSHGGLAFLSLYSFFSLGASTSMCMVLIKTVSYARVGDGLIFFAFVSSETYTVYRRIKDRISIFNGKAATKWARQTICRRLL